MAHHGEHGIAEYLAAGPDLLRTWTRAKRSTTRGGHPRGHSVVAAAIDLARTGLLTAPNRDLLEQAHTHYMVGTTYLRPEPFIEALEWAQQPGLGASSLLLPADGGPECWRAFDYLIEAVTAPIPAPIWELAVRRATGPDERLSIAINTYEAGREDLGWTVCESLARSGNPRAMNLVGYWAHQQGRHNEAENWLRKAVRSGFTAALNNLGLLLSARGETAEAEELYRRAIKEGNNYALSNLGLLLSDQGKEDEAEELYRRSADSGVGTGAYNLGNILVTRGQLREAERAYRDAIILGHLNSLFNLGILLGNQGRVAEAEEVYRRSAENDDVGSLINLGALLVDQQRYEEAEECYRHLGGIAHPDVVRNLGHVVALQGRLVEAEDIFRGAVDGGDLDSLVGLGSVLAQQGRLVQSVKVLERAVEVLQGSGQGERRKRAVSLVGEVRRFQKVLDNIRSKVEYAKDEMMSLDALSVDQKRVVKMVLAMLDAVRTLTDSGQMDPRRAAFELRETLRSLD